MDYKAELIRLKEYLQTEIQFISDEDDVRDRYARQANKNTLDKVNQILKRGEADKLTSELNTKALPLHGVSPSAFVAEDEFDRTMVVFAEDIDEAERKLRDKGHETCLIISPDITLH